MNWLKHAFAVEKPEDFSPTAIQAEVTRKLAAEIVRRGMATPALMFLEMSRPLNMVAASTMHYFTPIIKVITDGPGYEAFAAMLEHRGSIAYFMRSIEDAEGQIAGSLPDASASEPSSTPTGIQPRVPDHSSSPPDPR